MATRVTNPAENYETQVKGVRILPGLWRPHYPWEHIAWVSPPWASQEYLWLDFPEAVFTDRGLIFLSHINPAAPAVSKDWPSVPWESRQDGISFERTLPDGIVFGGSVSKASESLIDLELHIRNGSREPLRQIKLQTCAFLRAVREFGEYTARNKYLHTADAGWVSFSEADTLPAGRGPYGVGWRSSNGKADLPIMVTLSNQADRLVAMTWLQDTMSMVANPNHPCMHADPHFPDLEPGEYRSVAGRIFFHEGTLQDFDPVPFLA